MSTDIMRAIQGQDKIARDHRRASVADYRHWSRRALATRSHKGLQVHFPLCRFIAAVGQPSAITRDMGFIHHRRELKQGNRFSIPAERYRRDVLRCSSSTITKRPS